jgi:hypothetical protein
MTEKVDLRDVGVVIHTRHTHMAQGIRSRRVRTAALDRRRAWTLTLLGLARSTGIGVRAGTI